MQCTYGVINEFCEMGSQFDINGFLPLLDFEGETCQGFNNSIPNVQNKVIIAG